MNKIPNVSLDAFKADPEAVFDSLEGELAGVVGAFGVPSFYVISAKKLRELGEGARTDGLTVRAAAELVGVSHMTIHRDVKSGRLPASENEQGHTIVDKEVLEEFYAGRVPDSRIAKHKPDE